MAKYKTNEAQLPSLTNKIYFNQVDSKRTARQKKLLREWINNTIVKEKKLLGELSVNFCSDEHLLQINKEHLNHDYFTDIITFDLSEMNIISGDLYISTDRVLDNSFIHKTTFHVELNRVIIHGVLHLCGYKDKTASQQRQMREKENYYLSLL